MGWPTQWGGPKEDFLSLVRLGVGQPSCSLSEDVDWEAVEVLSVQQGLLAIVSDGIERLPVDNRPPKKTLLRFIGLVMQEEARYAVQQKAAGEMALLFHENSIRTYVLKGKVVAECYPKPEHRVSSDMDCFLVEGKGAQFSEDSLQANIWEKGNRLIKNAGYEVERDYYKNSSFYFPGMMVENHRFLVPFRGNKTLKKLEIILQDMLLADKGEDQFAGEWLYRPPVMVSALFLIEHAYSHFLHEGLTWRHVLDWVMFSRKHRDEIAWNDLDAKIDEFGFRKFYDSYHRLGKYLIGELPADDLLSSDKLMLEDVWAPLDLHETVLGVKGKLALVGNTWRARWKYHYFSKISMLHALWIQVRGVLFDKHPNLN